MNYSIKKRFKNVYARPLILVLLISFFCGGTAYAQEDTTASESSKDWNFLVEPYIMFPNMSGEVGLGETIRADVDASSGDIFGVLDFGAMLYLEAKNDTWAITSDFVYMSLESSLEPGPVVRSGTAGLDQTLWEVAGLYRLTGIFEAGLGFRLNYVDMTLSGQRIAIGEGNQPFVMANSVTMFDPIIVTRVMNDFGQRWNYIIRADAGGFGVGSDFTFQAQGYIGYSFSDLFVLSAGYRYLYFNYDEGSGMERMIMDLSEYGWTLRFGFRF